MNFSIRVFKPQLMFNFTFFSYCTHTAESSNNWWKAQLTSKAAVSRVKVYPRTDTHKSAIGGVEVNRKMNILVKLHQDITTLGVVHI